MKYIIVSIVPLLQNKITNYKESNMLIFGLFFLCVYCDFFPCAYAHAFGGC